MNRLKELRLENGLLQKDVAKNIGVSPQSYGYYENEVNQPDPATLIKLANFFKVSIDYLLCRTDDFGTPTAAPMHDVVGYSEEEKKLVEDYRALNFSGRKLVKQTVETLRATSAPSEKKKRV